MDDFLWRALAAGLGVALLAGPLGVFVVWRRMAYFGDTLAHSALLGVALGSVLGLPLNLAVGGVALLIAVLLLVLQTRRELAGDTLLGILAHSTLSLGLVLLAFEQGLRLDLMAYLFGDILAVDAMQVVWIWGGCLLALTLLALIWRHLLALTVHEELALVEGVPVLRTRLLFMLLIALVIAVSMQVVGVLLITSMMIIPAACARRFSRSPEQMALLAVIAGALAVVLGLGMSLRFDTPAAPSVVVAAASLFLLSQFVRGRDL